MKARAGRPARAHGHRERQAVTRGPRGSLRQPQHDLTDVRGAFHQPVRVGDGPDDGPIGTVYPDETTARQAAIAYNGADLAGIDLTLDPTPLAALDRDLTPALDL